MRLNDYQLIYDGSTLKSIPISSFPEAAWNISEDVNSTDPRQLRGLVATFGRCVHLRTSTVKSVPWSIYDLQTEKVVHASDWQSPPDDLKFLGDFKELIGRIEGSLLFDSQAFIFKNTSMSGRVIELKYLAPSTMEPKWNSREGLVGFTRTLDSQTENYARDNIIYIWSPDPLHETKPDIPEAQLAAHSAGVLYNVNTFMSNFFGRGAIKATLLQVEGNPSEVEKNKLKLLWDRMFRGNRKSWESGVISNKVTPVVIGSDLKDLTNITLTDEQRKEVATAFGIPHSMIMSNAATYATARVDKRNYYDETIVPEINLIEPQLNAQLFLSLGLQLKFQPERLDIYQTEESNVADAYAKYVAAGMPPSIAAEMLGLDLPGNINYADLDRVQNVA